MIIGLHDSPLEEGGFELAVPLRNGIAVEGSPGNGRRLDLTLRASVIMPASGLAARQNFRRSGDRQFESFSLQQ